MDRPTKEDLDAIRASHGQVGFSKTSAWCRMGAVLAEVDALTEERDGLRRDIGEMHGEAEAVGAEVQARQRRELAAVVLTSAAQVVDERLAERCKETRIAGGCSGWVRSDGLRRCTECPVDLDAADCLRQRAADLRGGR